MPTSARRYFRDLGVSTDVLDLSHQLMLTLTGEDADARFSPRCVHAHRCCEHWNPTRDRGHRYRGLHHCHGGKTADWPEHFFCSGGGDFLADYSLFCKVCGCGPGKTTLMGTWAVLFLSSFCVCPHSSVSTQRRLDRHQHTTWIIHPGNLEWGGLPDRIPWPRSQIRPPLTQCR